MSVGSGKTIIVVPAYNEAESVGAVVEQIRASGLQVLVVDDGSKDYTADIAREAGAAVLRLPFNLGVGGALRCGFRWAVQNGYDTAVQCDADGQHDPDELHRLITEAVTRDAHLLIGSRFGGSGGFEATRVRRIPMRLLSWLASRAVGARMTDATSGFRVIREPLLSEFARAYPVHYFGDTFEVLVQAGRRGYSVSEVPVTMKPRSTGAPSSGPAASIRNLSRVLAALAIGSSLRYREFMPAGTTKDSSHP